MNEEEHLEDNSYEQFLYEISNTAIDCGQEPYEAFFYRVTNLLIEEGEIQDAIFAPFKRPGLQFAGYGGNPLEDNRKLTVFLTDFTQSEELEGLYLKDLEALVKRGTNFISKINSKEFLQIEESNPVFSAIQTLSGKMDLLSQIRIIVLTNKVIKIRSDSLSAPKIGDIKAQIIICDYERIELLESGVEEKPEIIIDLEEHKKSLPVLVAHSFDSSYQSYLTVLPGDLIAEIFDDWGNRLLEKNVRVFLQATSKINRGIRDTIQDTPSMFFAYNNGITATADDVIVQTLETGVRAITKIINLQIVNGGQTVSSIYAASKFANKFSNADLSKVCVQMKLSKVENDSEEADSFVSDVSRFANTQNKVNVSDFSSNHSFHVQIENLSKKIAAPPAPNSLRSSHWFYERSRGQYKYAKSKNKTKAQKKNFDKEFPSKQKIDKVDLAFYQNQWDCKIESVMRGKGNASYVDFFNGIEEVWAQKSDQFNERYFKELVSKAIIYKDFYREMSRQSFSDFKSTVGSFTIGLLASKLKQSKTKKFNFMKVWSEQSINKDFTEELIRVAKRINFLIMNPPLGMNRDAREYARNKQCWENIQKEDIQWTKKLDSYLISSSECNKLEKIEKEKTLKIEELDLVNKIENAPVQIWQEIEDWVNAQNMIKLTGSDSILLRDAKGMKEIFTPTIGQSKRLLDIYDLVKEYGFEGEI